MERRGFLEGIFRPGDIPNTLFTVTREMLGNDKKLLLNLGEVRDLAEINVNGSAGPTLVMHPYEVDITGLVKPGDNVLELIIVNSLENAMLRRMLRMGITLRMTQMQEAMREKLLTSQSSGLLGPVTLFVRG